MNRGVIRHRGRAEQGRDFSGLVYGKISPTDIDASMDFQGRVFVFMEAKVNGWNLDVGQRLHLANLCEAITKGGAKALALVLSHNVPIDDQINFAECKVDEYYWQPNGWLRPSRSLNCREAIDEFLDLVTR